MSNEPGKKPVLHTKKHVARLERERRQTRIILYVFIGMLAAVLLLVGYGYLDINYLQLNKAVAKVGDSQIIEKEFEARVRLQRQQLLGQYAQYSQYQQAFGMDFSKQLDQINSYLNTPTLLGQTILDQMIDEALIREEAKKRGITASPDELSKFIQSQFNYFPDGTYTPTVTPTEVTLPEPPADAFKIVTVTPISTPTLPFTLTPTITLTPESATGTPVSTLTLEPTATPTATLAPIETPTAEPTATALPTATPYTLDGFQTAYDSAMKDFLKFGLTEENYRQLLETQILQDKLKEVILKDIAPVEEQVWARHILVADPGLAITIIDKLKAGEDFASLATQFSIDTGSAPKGGDLGWFGKGAMVPEFETAAFALKNPGDYTLEPVKSQFGYHIIQLIARQNRPLTASQYEQARSKTFKDWLAALRTSYKVETFDFWKTRVPTEPNFSTMATEAVNAVNTKNAEAAAATATP